MSTKYVKSQLLWRLLRNPAVLEITASGDLNEHARMLFSFRDSDSALNQLRSALWKAAADPLLRGIRLRIDRLSCGLAKVSFTLERFSFR